MTRPTVKRLPDVPPSEADIEAPAERRQGRGGDGSLSVWRLLRGALKRPLRLQRRGSRWHLVLVDRRRNPPHQTRADARLSAELRARLGALDREHVMQTMRPLVRVYEELRRRGWPGVESLGSRTLARAAHQARLLHDLEPNPALARLADRLRLMQAAAEAREERARTVRQEAVDAAPEVRETDFAEFERAGLDSGLHTVPVPAERDDGHETVSPAPGLRPERDREG